jgi:hypothetical protein
MIFWEVIPFTLVGRKEFQPFRETSLQVKLEIAVEGCSLLPK